MFVKLENAQRERLAGRVRILIYRQRDRKLEAETELEAEQAEQFFFDGLEELELYHVRVFPAKHRPAAKFARPGQRITIHCPVKPEAVRRLEFNRLTGIEPLIRTPGDLEDEALAGALNVWGKMSATDLGGRPVSHYVKRIIRINPDRMWFEPAPEMLELVIRDSQFSEVSGSLHELRDYHTGRSFKTGELYGNLQLTFLHRYDRPETLVDADVDEAGGLLHAFQVLRNALTGGKTHPYDIHEILNFHQELDLGYRLIV